jgi:hypothetical protein
MRAPRFGKGYEMSWTPEIPKIHRAAGKDGKERLYLLASNEMDIMVMLHAAGLFQEGIHQQNNQYLGGYYRIIKHREEKQFLEVFS